MISKFERFIAHRYLRSSKQEGFISVIAWFSLIGIALGVATLIIVMSVMNGFREELLGRIIGLNGHMSVMTKGVPFTDYDKIADEVKKIPGITAVYPVIERQAMVLYKNQARGVAVHGIKPDDLKQRKMVADNIREGALTSFGAFDREGEKTYWGAIGRRLADTLALKVGDKLTLVSPEGNASAFGTLPMQKSFYVGAIFEVGLNDYDKGVVFIPLESAQTLFKFPESISNLEVFVDNADAVAARNFSVKATIGDAFHIYDWQNANNSLFNAVQVERNVMFIILTLLVLIAAFNILSSLIMLVKDKTRDIAIMRTMGATQKNITTIFMITGASIGLVGTLVGVVGGLAFALNIERIREFLQKLTGTELFNAEIYFLTQLPSKVDMVEVMVIVVVALLLTFLSTLYPSWRAAKLDPVEALRQ
ncbi:lipoprotein-releasing ABC transporter permease subunit [Candidatus Paracaedibacter symbiosus]|uniref:lipoprotein-releasing ABC transporter permease subunit n=1 Tax=Candidatus Paracaedibacter symbiosus TaxID=244582 RepID=UPI000509D5AB|nr:lipoprotein-releasing ABC transporter permease subunit [Candidatus Paracaedibacter symbiosus]